MAEYIEREAVKAAVRKRLNNSLIIGWLISIINDCPAAEVAQVRHGRWIRYPECGVTKCSLCDWSIEECWHSDYCPNCGAKMDGGAD